MFLKKEALCLKKFAKAMVLKTVCISTVESFRCRGIFSTKLFGWYWNYLRVLLIGRLSRLGIKPIFVIDLTCMGFFFFLISPANVRNTTNTTKKPNCRAKNLKKKTRNSTDLPVKQTTQNIHQIHLVRRNEYYGLKIFPSYA